MPPPSVKISNARIIPSVSSGVLFSQIYFHLTCLIHGKKGEKDHTETCLHLQLSAETCTALTRKWKELLSYADTEVFIKPLYQIFWYSLLSLFGASFLVLHRHKEWRLHLHPWLSIHQPSCYFIVVYDTSSGVLFSNNCFIYCQEDQHRFTDYCSYISWPLSYHCWRTHNIPPDQNALGSATAIGKNVKHHWNGVSFGKYLDYWRNTRMFCFVFL